MAKKNRGKGLWDHPTRGRGTCPVCRSTRTKLLYDLNVEGGDSIKVCKRCRNRSVNNDLA